MTTDRIMGRSSARAKASSSGKDGRAKAKRDDLFSGDTGTSWGLCYQCEKPSHHDVCCPGRGKRGGSRRGGWFDILRQS